MVTACLTVLIKDPVKLCMQSQHTSCIKTSPQKCPKKHKSGHGIGIENCSLES